MRRSLKTGFTLIELMITAAILAILAMIALPKFADLIIKAQEAAVKGKLGALRSAITIYNSNTEGINPLVLASLTIGGTYLDAIPKVDPLPRYPTHRGTGFALLGTNLPGVPADCSNYLKTGAEWWPYQNGTVVVGCSHTDSRGNVWSTW